jgi:hypothetical protein
VIAVLLMVWVKASDAAVDAPLTAIATGLSGLVVLLILYRVISPPDFGSIGGVSFDATRKAGLWLGLIASIGMAYGSYRAMEEEGTSFSDAADRFSGGGGGGAGGGAPPRPPAPPHEPPSAPPPPPPPPSSGV